jgi:hypothetical protein
MFLGLPDGSSPIILVHYSGFIFKCPFNGIAGFLEFDQGRKLRWFLLASHHRGNQLSSPVTEDLAKSPQIREVVSRHM